MRPHLPVSLMYGNRPLVRQSHRFNPFACPNLTVVLQANLTITTLHIFPQRFLQLHSISPLVLGIIFVWDIPRRQRELCFRRRFQQTHPRIAFGYVGFIFWFAERDTGGCSTHRAVSQSVVKRVFPHVFVERPNFQRRIRQNLFHFGNDLFGLLLRCRSSLMDHVVRFSAHRRVVTAKPDHVREPNAIAIPISSVLDNPDTPQRVQQHQISTPSVRVSQSRIKRMLDSFITSVKFAVFLRVRRIRIELEIVVIHSLVCVNLMLLKRCNRRSQL